MFQSQFNSLIILSHRRIYVYTALDVAILDTKSESEVRIVLRVGSMRLEVLEQSRLVLRRVTSVYADEGIVDG